MKLRQTFFVMALTIYRSSHPEVFLRKSVLKIYSKFTGEHSCRSVISIKLQSNFIEITLRHGCSPVNLLHIFRTFSMNTSGWLLLNIGYTKNPSQQTFVGLRRLKDLISQFLVFHEVFKTSLRSFGKWEIAMTLKNFFLIEKKKILMGIFRVGALGTGFNSVFPLNWCVYTTVLNDTYILQYSC